MPTSSRSSLDRFHRSLWALGLLLLLVHSSLAVLVNNTVDDTFADPRTGDTVIYTPEGAWSEGSANCARCIAHPSEQSLYRGTWHEGMVSHLFGRGQVMGAKSQNIDRLVWGEQWNSYRIYGIHRHRDLCLLCPSSNYEQSEWKCRHDFYP